MLRCQADKIRMERLRQLKARKAARLATAASAMLNGDCSDPALEPEPARGSSHHEPVVAVSVVKVPSAAPRNNNASATASPTSFSVASRMGRAPSLGWKPFRTRNGRTDSATRRLQPRPLRNLISFSRNFAAISNWCS